jgi:hypothetical protein
LAEESTTAHAAGTRSSGPTDHPPIIAATDCRTSPAARIPPSTTVPTWRKPNDSRVIAPLTDAIPNATRSASSTAASAVYAGAFANADGR